MSELGQMARSAAMNKSRREGLREAARFCESEARAFENSGRFLEARTLRTAGAKIRRLAKGKNP